MNLFAFSGLLSGFSSLLFGLFVFFYGKQKNIKAIFLSFAISVAVWNFGVYKIATANNPEDALFWWRSSYIGVIFISVFFLHFVYLFLEDKKRKLLYIAYFLAFFFLLILYSDLFMSRVVWRFSSFYYLLSTGYFYPVFVFLWFGEVFYAHYKLLRAYKKSSALKKEQIKYFFLAMIVGFSGGATCFLPIFNINIYPIMNFTIALYPAIMAYAVVKHNLMDVRLVIQRSLIYSILFAIIIALYLSVLFVFAFLFPQTGYATHISAIITAIIGIFGAPIIEKYFRRLTDRIFFKDKYDYSEALYSLSEILNKNIEIKTLLKEIQKKIQNILKLESLKIVLLNHNLVINKKGVLRKPLFKLSKNFLDKVFSFNFSVLDLESFQDLWREKVKEKALFKEFEKVEKFLISTQVKIIAVIKTEKEIIGFLLLGDKKSGDMFSGEDINLLKTFSSQASTAFVKAKLYKEVKDYSLNLEKKVEQRTAKIKGLQEEQKQIMLEVSHGLQTPLTIVKGELELLKKQKVDTEILATFEKSIDKISKFIYDMLRLSRLETLNKENNFIKQKINFSELLLEMVEYFQIVFDEKGIVLKSDIEPNLYILGDKEKIEEMVSNLVGNAQKYIDKKKKKHFILVSLHKKNNEAVLIIEDNGIGIKKEDLPNLFKKFFRAKDKEHSGIKGTGLGLVICRKIAELHNVKIQVESEFGQGTKFILNFKLYDGE